MSARENIQKEPYVVSFDDNSATDRALVGGKGANLAQLVDAGLPVLAGFCVTTAAYEAMIADPTIEEAINELSDLTPTDTVTIAETGGALRARIQEGDVPEEIRNAIENTLTRTQTIQRSRMPFARARQPKIFRRRPLRANRRHVPQRPRYGRDRRSRPRLYGESVHRSGDLDLVMMDREFDSNPVKDTCEEHGVHYLNPTRIFERSDEADTIEWMYRNGKRFHVTEEESNDGTPTRKQIYLPQQSNSDDDDEDDSLSEVWTEMCGD